VTKIQINKTSVSVLSSCDVTDQEFFETTIFLRILYTLTNFFTVSEAKILTTQYVRLNVLTDFITTNLGDTLQFKVATVFNSHFTRRYKPWNYFQFGVKRPNLFKKHFGLS
jgi:hypothetical protein